jgi:exosortase
MNGTLELAARAEEGTVPSLLEPIRREHLLPLLLTGGTFAVLFYQPFTTLVRDWWTQPEAGHGLLLAPVAVWLAWRTGRHPKAAPQIWIGALILVLAVLLRGAAGLAAELFTMRVSMVGALVGLTVYFLGVQQVLRWWLPFTLAFLSVPLPELVTQALALPLQFKASQMGAAMLEMRHVPVLLSGNIIRIPGHELFVTEACSGLRSLTALVSMAILVGAMFLRTPVARLLLLLLAIPIAIIINGVRVFLTGFLVYFVSPGLGTGFMHSTEGWLLFLVSLAALAGIAGIGMFAERRFFRSRAVA